MPSTSFDLDLEVIPVSSAVLEATTNANGTSPQGKSVTTTTTQSITSATVTLTCCC